MMRKLLFTLLLLFPLFLSAQISYELLAQYTKLQISGLASALSPPEGAIKINYDVDYYKVTYHTLHPNGDSVLVTGGLAVPHQTSCPLPLSSYLHGTVFNSSDVPSNLNPEGLLGLVEAAAGYVVAMPDYIGLGDSPGIHLYMHAESEAQSGLDLLRATVDLGPELGYNLNGQLFLYGYSQGGHSCMALHRMIQENTSDEFTVTHSTPMSGPYDMSGAQSEPLFANNPYSVPGYIPYLISSYQEVYGNLYASLDEIYQPATANIVQQVMDGEIGYTQANNLLPNTPGGMFQPEYFTAVQENPEHPLRQALADNDVYDWAPESTMTLYGCTADEQVFYENLEVAYDAMVANGSTGMQFVNIGPFTHGGCANFALFFGYTEFETKRESSNLAYMEVTVVNATSDDGMNGSASLEFLNEPDDAEAFWSNGAVGEEVDGLAPGFYTVSLIDQNDCAVSRIFEVELVQSVFEAQLVSSPAWTISRTHNLLNIEGTLAGQQIFLFDLSGKLLVNQTANGTFDQVSLDALPHGYYLLKGQGVLKGCGFVK